MPKKNAGSRRNGQSDAKLGQLHDRLLKASLEHTQLSPSVADLLKACTEIDGIVKDIKILQGDNKHLASPETDDERRKSLMTTFTEWCKSNGVKADDVELAAFPDYGIGLKAKYPLEKGEEFVSIPSSFIFSLKHPHKLVAKLLNEDKIIASMNNVGLAINVIAEKIDYQSKWKPFFDMMPASYNSALYFTLEEISLLQGTDCYIEMLKIRRSIARQYAYFWIQFNQNPEYRFFKQSFTYEMYRWAVSTVMTRQQLLDGIGLNLVPFWDMTNHKSGRMSTEYIEEEKAHTLTCKTVAPVKQGQQVFMTYSNHSNSEFLVHNGFIVHNNPNEALEFTITLSKDALLEKKTEFLEKSTLSYTEKDGDAPVGRFSLIMSQTEFNPLLVFFVKLHRASEADLDLFNAELDKTDVTNCSLAQQEEVYKQFLTRLNNPSLNTELDQKTWQFIQVKLTVTKLGMKGKFPEKRSEMTPRQKLAHDLVESQKKLLDKYIEICAEKLKQSRLKTEVEGEKPRSAVMENGQELTVDNQENTVEKTNSELTVEGDLQKLTVEEAIAET